MTEGEQGDGASGARVAGALAGAPQALGRFRIEATLGGGSFGTVYRAFDPLVGEQVALKVLRPELGKDTEQMERLRREVVLARKVDHPGVCRIHDLHQDGETLFVVMELVDGETLDQVCARGPLPPRRAAAIVEGMLRALAAAHDVGVLHRDIKPSNVMVRAVDAAGATRDDVTLVDFGIATGQGLEHLTRPGVALGTVGYLAPELWEGKSATPLSDVFAAGVMLYGVLTGKMPWRAPPLALLSQMKRVPPVAPSLLAPAAGIDARLDDIVLRAIRTQPDERFASARAFADALAAWRAGAHSDAHPGAASSSPSPPSLGHDDLPRDTLPAPTSSRAPLVVAALVVALVAAGALLAWARLVDDDATVASRGRADVDARAPVDVPPGPPAAPVASAVGGAALAAATVPPVEPAPPGDELSEDDVVFEEARAVPRPRDDVGRAIASARAELQQVMQQRGFTTGDVPLADTALRSRIGGMKAVANLEAALAEVKRTQLDRAFVERKLARLQVRAGASSNAQLDALAAGIASDIAAKRYADANAKLNRALALVR